MCSPVSAPLRGRPIWDYVRRARDDVIPLIDGLGTALAGCPRPLLLTREVRDLVVERRVLRLRLLRFLRHRHSDAVDELASERGLLAAKHDHVADPVVRVVADASAEDVE